MRPRAVGVEEEAVQEAVSFTRREVVERGATIGAALALAPFLRFVDEAEAATDPRLAALDRAVRGPLLRRGTAAYEAARRPYNARFDGVRPLAVVRPRDARDVQAVVRWAAKTRVPIAARSGGHSYGGYSTTRGVVVDLSQLDGVRVARGRAAVGAGARLGNVYATLGQRALAIPAGTCPSVGIAGLTLGGGYGLASRAWGLTCDNLLEVDVVTADGRLLTCNAKRHADLFWASRGGGGGNFGIATRFVFRTHKVGAGSYFVATWPWPAVEQVVDRFLRWAPKAPAELTAICRLATGGGNPSVQVFGQYLGSEAALENLLPGLTRDLPAAKVTTGSESWLDLVRRWGDCRDRPLRDCTSAEPTSFAAGSDYIAKPLPPGGLAALRKAVEARGSARGSILIDAYGGAINRVAPTATAFAHRRMLASCQYYAPGDAAAARAWVRATDATMRPYVSGAGYQNYIDPELANWQRAYYGVNLRRLTAVKRRYDRRNVFRFKQSIPLRA